MDALYGIGTGLLMAVALPSVGQDWPAWGGADAGRNMFSAVKNLPERFDPGKLKPGSEEVDMSTTRNVRWVAKLGSQTYGNPVVVGGRVYVGTNNEPPRDSRYEGDRSILLCLDEKTGALLWQLAVPKLKAGKANDWESLGILSCPQVQGNRVYLVTSRAEVICLDVEGMANGNDGMTNEAQYAVQELNIPPMPPGPKDADILWVYDMIHELGVFPHNAANGAPLLWNGVLYAPTSNGADNSQNNIPFPNAPSLIALDPRTGALLAEDDARFGAAIFHGQWGSPSAGTVNGRSQVYYGGGDGWLYAFDAAPVRDNNGGRLKVAWKADCNPPEYRVKDGKPVKYGDAEGPSEINATPVFFKNRVYVAIGQDPEQGDGVGRLVCLDATATGDATKSGLVWEFKDIRRSISTVAIDPASDLLFAADYSGFVYCMDAATGKLCWKHDMKAHIWGSPLVADGRVWIGDEDGDVAVLAVAREMKLLSEVNMGGALYSTPVAANGTLYIVTPSHLYALKDERLKTKD